MDQDPKYFFIGLIVLTLVAGLSFFLLWAANSTEVAEKINYAIYLKAQSPAGLQKDGLVMMKGIKVGTVQEIMFDPTDVERVLVQIVADSNAPIKTDTAAIVRSNYVTSLSYIDLIDSTKESPLLREVGEKKKGRFFIPEGITKLDELQNTLPEILDNTSNLLKQMEKFLSNSNVAQIAKLLENTEKITATVASQSDDIGSALSSFSKAANNLSQLTQDLKTAMQTILAQTNKIAEDSQKLLTKTANKFEQAGDSVSSMAQSIKQGKETILGPTEKNLLND